MSTALNAEYRKVITARYIDKPCHTCGNKLVEGDFAATNDFKAWLSYCSRCAASFAAQVSGLVARVEARVAPLGDNVPRTIAAQVATIEPYIERVLNGDTDLATVTVAKGGLFQVLSMVQDAVPPPGATPDPLIDALRAIAATNDRDSNFAGSLVRGFNKYGSLTDPQRRAAENMITKRSSKAQAQAAAAVQRQPIPVVEVGLYRDDDGTIRRVYKTSRGRISTRRYDGKQFVFNGTPGLRHVADGIAAGTTRLLNALEASAFGRQAGICFNCLSIGRPGILSDDRSLAVGYGEICANHNGWWYPSADEAAQILRGTLDLDAKLTQSLLTGAPLPSLPSQAELDDLVERMEAGESLADEVLSDDDLYVDESPFAPTNPVVAAVEAAVEELEQQRLQAENAAQAERVRRAAQISSEIVDAVDVDDEDDDEVYVPVSGDNRTLVPATPEQIAAFPTFTTPDTVASKPAEAAVRPAEASGACERCNDAPAVISVVCEHAVAHRVCHPCRRLVVSQGCAFTH